MSTTLKSSPDKLEYNRVRNRLVGFEQKLAVMTHYSHGLMECECGESRIQCLTIDHINGGGNKHRKEVGEGVTFYRWLIKNNFPEGFRVLCMNCNFYAHLTKENVFYT